MNTKRRSQLIGATVILAAAACGKSASPVDDGLARDLAAIKSASSDLELAPRAAKPQVVVSAIEGGPQAATARAPKAPSTRSESHAPQTRAPKPAVQTSVRSATVAEQAPAPAPAPAPRKTSERSADPAPLPSSGAAPREQQHGTYSTEAEIFRRMPWIRP